MPKKTLFIDVMCKGRFVTTFRYQYCPLFTIDLNDVATSCLLSVRHCVANNWNSI